MPIVQYKIMITNKCSKPQTQTTESLLKRIKVKYGLRPYGTTNQLNLNNVSKSFLSNTCLIKYFND